MKVLVLARYFGFTIKEVPVRWINDPTSLVKAVDYFIVFLDIVKILTRVVFGAYNKLA